MSNANYENIKVVEAVGYVRETIRNGEVEAGRKLVVTYCRFFGFKVPGFDAEQFQRDCFAPPPSKASVDRLINAIYGAKN